MASTYSPNLRLELIGTGEQQGTWGATTNTNLGTLLEEAIGGYTSVTVADAGDTTLTTANGAADQSRNMTLNLSGTLTATRNVICPAIEKIYVVKNATSGGFAVTFKVTGQTGVSIPNGATMLIYVDGVDARQAGAIVGASNAVLATSIELGGTTDTTITRSAAGVIAVEGGVVPKENRANTFTADQRIDAKLGIGGAPTTDLIEVRGTFPKQSFYNSGVRQGVIGLGVNTGYGDTLGMNAIGAYSSLSFGTNNTERIRVDSSGLVSIGSTGQPGYGSGSGFAVTQTGVFSSGVTGSGDSAYTQRDTAGSYLKFWYGPLGSVPTSPGGITTTGTAVAYNTSSDYRLKEDIRPVANAASRLMSLSPVNFAWKADGSRVDGFIAHEAQEVVPEAVTGAKDAVDADGNPVYQGIDQSKLVPLLTAALQEALTEISSLKARVAALEAA